MSQYYELDDTFGNGDGKAIIDLMTGSQEYAYSIVIDNNEKIVVAGYIGNWPQKFAIIRLNKDGSFDTTFNSLGQTPGIRILTEVNFTLASSVAVDKVTNKIIVGGYGYDFSSGLVVNFIVIRLNTDGNLDTSFNSGSGVKIINISGSDRAYSVLVEDVTSKIFIAGYSDNGGGDDFVVVKLNTNGSYDTNFGDNGIKTINIGHDNQAHSVLLDSNSKIVLSGYTTETTSIDRSFAIIRLDSSGNLDTTFNETGTKTVNIAGTKYDDGNAAVIDSNNNIIVVGNVTTTSTNNDDIGVIKVKENGEMDISFNGTGEIIIDISGGTSDRAYAVVLDENEKIVIVGHSYVTSGNHDFAVVRLNTDGSRDTTFNVNGEMKIDIGVGTNDFGKGIVRDLSNNLLVAGWSNTYSTTKNDFVVIRLKDSTPPTPPDNPEIILKIRGFRKTKPYEWLKRRYFTINQ
tara:strand:+ start:1125 stop:2498 length:1374 start_codon:yes stop_codon:yes gene_type:complete